MSEFETIGLEPVESLAITTLVDNVTGILLLDEGPAIRAPIASRAPRVPSPLVEGGHLAGAAIDATHAATIALLTGVRPDRRKPPLTNARPR